MTATIDPGIYRESVFLKDKDLRIREYIEALHYWLSHPDMRMAGVVFCENSGFGYMLEKHFENADTSRPLELLSYSGNVRPPAVHYGYAELGIIDHAVENSKILQSCEHFVKVTGRLTFPRISRLLNTLDDTLEVAVDHRHSYRNEAGPRLRARTQLMVFKTTFYKTTFFHRRDEMLGRYSHIEEFVAAKLLEYQKKPGVVLRWKIECPPIGSKGHGEGRYTVGTAWLKTKLRGCIRRLLPSLWL